MLLRKYVPVIVLCFVSVLFLFSYYKFNHNTYLSFSDGAKFADIGRNISMGKGYGASFTRFSNDLQLNSERLFPIGLIPPLMPYLNALTFALFGVSDLAVIVTTSFLYFLLTISVFLLGKKLWGNLVGLLSAMVVVSNVNFLDYATSGASEVLFTLEIVFAAYLFILRKKWTSVAGLLILILMYFTRAQAIIYIFGFILLFFTLNFPIKKALSYFVSAFIVGSLLFFSTSNQGTFAITQHLPGVSSSDAIRGAAQEFTISSLFKKVFYNIYNFYRLLPEIASPYMWGLFFISLFKWEKDRIENSLKLSTLFMVIITFLVTAITIPFFRYLHPVIPLVYLFATATLVWIVRKIVNNQWVMIKKWPITNHFRKNDLVVGIYSLLVIFFVIGQTLGVIFLDSRFKRARANTDKSPVYVTLSGILKDNTKESDVVVTNLDTWGSWYGERKTVWFPLKPDQLNTEDSENVQFDAIYLTSHLIDDENYYMCDEWRDIFLNPELHNQQFIKDNYEYVGEFNIPAFETYEMIEGKAVLFTRKR